MTHEVAIQPSDLLDLQSVNKDRNIVIRCNDPHNLRTMRRLFEYCNVDSLRGIEIILGANADTLEFAGDAVTVSRFLNSCHHLNCTQEFKGEALTAVVKGLHVINEHPRMVSRLRTQAEKDSDIISQHRSQKAKEGHVAPQRASTIITQELPHRPRGPKKGILSFLYRKGTATPA